MQQETDATVGGAQHSTAQRSGAQPGAAKHSRAQDDPPTSRPGGRHRLLAVRRTRDAQIRQSLQGHTQDVRTFGDSKRRCTLPESEAG